MNQNNKNKIAEDYSDEDDYYPSQKKVNLHNIKFIYNYKNIYLFINLSSKLNYIYNYFTHLIKIVS